MSRNIATWNGTAEENADIIISNRELPIVELTGRELSFDWSPQMAFSGMPQNNSKAIWRVNLDRYENNVLVKIIMHIHTFGGCLFVHSSKIRDQFEFIERACITDRSNSLRLKRRVIDIFSGYSTEHIHCSVVKMIRSVQRTPSLPETQADVQRLIDTNYQNFSQRFISSLLIHFPLLECISDKLTVSQLSQEHLIALKEDVMFYIATGDCVPTENLCGALDTFIPEKPDQKKWNRHANDLLSSLETSKIRARGLLLTGHIGQGKTHVAVSIAKKCVQHGLHPIYLKPSAFRHFLENQAAILSSIPTGKRVIWILDDCNSPFGDTGDVFRAMISLVNSRSDILIVTSNTPYAEFISGVFSTFDPHERQMREMADALFGDSIIQSPRTETVQRPLTCQQSPPNSVNLQTFFCSADRRQRTEKRSKHNRISFLNVPLCSNAVGKATTGRIFHELLERANRLNWRATSPLIDVPNFDAICRLPNASYADNSEATIAYVTLGIFLTKLSLVSIDLAQVSIQSFGRTNVLPFNSPVSVNGKSYHGVAIKHIRYKETPDSLNRELRMQALFAADPNFRSSVPMPLNSITFSSHSRDETHAIAFAIPSGYYDYLSKVQDRDRFIHSACSAAHDLGYALKQYGLVFPALISIFHAEHRPYTLFPTLTGAENVHFGGLPGKIENVIGKELYENIGISGLRDLGDLTLIETYCLDRDERGNSQISMPLKIAHFISLYLMVFTLLMGNRSRMLEELTGDKAAAWCDNDKIYSEILRSMFEGLGIKLSPEISSYIDPSLLKPDLEDSKLEPGEKFNRQLYFCFTKDKDSVFGRHIIYPNCQPEMVSTLRHFYGERVTFFCGDGRDTLMINMANLDEERYREFYYGGPEAYQFSREADFYQKQGWLGQFSGINPLTTASKYAIRAAEEVVKAFYQLSNRPAESLNVTARAPRQV